jgi:FAD/FMN-containing dehydrogenase
LLFCLSLQATIVTADGQVVTASDTENTDLFFALRGGGSNFGVATEFVLQLYPQRRTVYAGMVMFTTDKLEKIVEATASWFPTAGEREGMLQGVTLGPDGNVPYHLWNPYMTTDMCID